MIGIIIQARMGSTRLPGKILRNIGETPLLKHILDRLQLLSQNAYIVIATSSLEKDNIVEEFCKNNSVACFRGSEDNVLLRYYDCATFYGFSDIVRMTGDNPFPDIEELDRLLLYHRSHNMDFTENFSVLPIGVGMEVISYKALEESVHKASISKHFEHVDEYILDNLVKFRHATVEVNKDKNKPDVRLTVDTYSDYVKACYIVDKANVKYVTTEKAIELVADYEREISIEEKFEKRT